MYRVCNGKIFIFIPVGLYRESICHGPNCMLKVNLNLYYGNYNAVQGRSPYKVAPYTGLMI